jgi:hypothetical protein
VRHYRTRADEGDAVRAQLCNGRLLRAATNDVVEPHAGGNQLVDLRALSAVRSRIDKAMMLLAGAKLERPDNAPPVCCGLHFSRRIIDDEGLARPPEKYWPGLP